MKAAERIWSKVAHRMKTMKQGSFELDRNDLLALRRETDLLRQLLSLVSEAQWNGYAFSGVYPCICCGNEKSEGHTPDCKLGSLLKELT